MGKKENFCFYKKKNSLFSLQKHIGLVSIRITSLLNMAFYNPLMI